MSQKSEFDQSLHNALAQRKDQFMDKTKSYLMDKLRPIINYQIRNAIAPETITEEQELNQYYIDEALDQHQASDKTHPYMSFSEWRSKVGAQ